MSDTPVDRSSRTAYQEWLGVRFEERADGTAVASIEYDEKLTNPYGVVNGGIIATLVDLASGRLLATTFDPSEEHALATVDIDVRFLAPATDDLRAEASLVRAGSSLGTTRVDVECGSDDERELVAIGATTYRIFDP